MARLTKVYYGSFHRSKPHRSKITEDEVRTYKVDFNGALESSESVSSVSWTTDDDAVIAISGAALSSGVASVTVTASEEGTARLYCIATLNTSRKLKQWFQIEVVDEADVR